MVAHRSKEAADSMVGAEDPGQVEAMQRFGRVPARELGLHVSIACRASKTGLAVQPECTLSP